MLPAERSWGRGARRLRVAGAASPPTGLVLLAVCSMQVGAAVAKGLFESVGPSGAVFHRVGFAAVLLLAVSRPSLRGHERGALGEAAAFGLALAMMNLAFYGALDRIPLGLAVTLEFVGPLGVAVAGSRRPLDLLWAALAAGGILLLAPLPGGGLDPAGVALALLAGACWAGYIVMGARVGRLFPGGAGLALALGFGALVLAPLGVLSGGAELLHWRVLLAGLGVALLSSAIPFTLEYEALRRLPTRAFGVLMSTEPAAAALVGLLFLGERLSWRGLLAVALVTAAAVGVSRYGARD